MTRFEPLRKKAFSVTLTAPAAPVVRVPWVKEAAMAEAPMAVEAASTETLAAGRHWAVASPLARRRRKTSAS